MLASRGWQKFALFLNLAGTILLFLSFQATSSNIKIVTTRDSFDTALCVEGRGIVVAMPRGEMAFNLPHCPDWNNAKPAAVVNIERPFLVTFSFSLLAIGFLLQYLAVPDPSTIEQLRKDVKSLRQRRTKGR